MRRLDNIDIRLLRIFVAIADAGGFVRAQTVLNLSQPTLSTHLIELEKRLGGRLCDRGHQQFRLTELGRATYDAALKLFGDMEDFNQRVSSASVGLSGRLRIGVTDGTFTNPRLSAQSALAAFMQPEMDVFVDLLVAMPTELELQLANGDRDVIIGPFSEKAPGLIYEPLMDEPHHLYCADRHPLYFKQDSMITHQDIEESRYSVRSYRHLDDLYDIGHPRAGASILHMEAQLTLILSGHFIGFLPCHLAEELLHQGRLRAIKPNELQYNCRHTVAFRRAEATRPLISSFVQSCIKSCRDL